MACSEAQLAANRANAARSTEPKSVEGKERSRRNALRHGLTGAGIVLPTEDLAAIEARFTDFAADLRPEGGVERFLVQRAALLSVRLDRSALHEAASLTTRIHALESTVATDPDAGMNDLFDALIARPGSAREELIGQPAGVERLVAALLMLGQKLKADPDAWTAGHARILEALLGHDSGTGPARSKLLSDVVLGDLTQLRSAETTDFDPAAKRRWAADRLARLIDAEIDQLTTLAATLPPPSSALNRTAAHLALFDASPEAILARRYEATTERALFRTLKEIRHAKTQQESAQQVAVLDLPSFPPESGSFGAAPRPAAASRQLPLAPPLFADPGLDRGPLITARRPEQVVIGRAAPG